MLEETQNSRKPLYFALEHECCSQLENGLAPITQSLIQLINLKTKRAAKPTILLFIGGGALRDLRSGLPYNDIDIKLFSDLPQDELKKEILSANIPGCSNGSMQHPLIKITSPLDHDTIFDITLYPIVNNNIFESLKLAAANESININSFLMPIILNGKGEIVVENRVYDFHHAQENINRDHSKPIHIRTTNKNLFLNNTTYSLKLIFYIAKCKKYNRQIEISPDLLDIMENNFKQEDKPNQHEYVFHEVIKAIKGAYIGEALENWEISSRLCIYDDSHEKEITDYFIKNILIFSEHIHTLIKNKEKIDLKLILNVFYTLLLWPIIRLKFNMKLHQTKPDQKWLESFKTLAFNVIEQYNKNLKIKGIFGVHVTSFMLIQEISAHKRKIIINDYYADEITQNLKSVFKGELPIPPKHVENIKTLILPISEFPNQQSDIVDVVSEDKSKQETTIEEKMGETEREYPQSQDVENSLFQPPQKQEPTSNEIASIVHTDNFTQNQLSIKQEKKLGMESKNHQNETKSHRNSGAGTWPAIPLQDEKKHSVYYFKKEVSPQIKKCDKTNDETTILDDAIKENDTLLRKSKRISSQAITYLSTIPLPIPAFFTRKKSNSDKLIKKDQENRKKIRSIFQNFRKMQNAPLEKKLIPHDDKINPLQVKTNASLIVKLSKIGQYFKPACMDMGENVIFKGRWSMLRPIYFILLLPLLYRISQNLIEGEISVIESITTYALTHSLLIMSDHYARYTQLHAIQLDQKKWAKIQETEKNIENTPKKKYQKNHNRSFQQATINTNDAILKQISLNENNSTLLDISKKIPSVQINPTSTNLASTSSFLLAQPKQYNAGLFSIKNIYLSSCILGMLGLLYFADEKNRPTPMQTAIFLVTALSLFLKADQLQQFIEKFLPAETNEEENKRAISSSH